MKGLFLGIAFIFSVGLTCQAQNTRANNSRFPTFREGAGISGPGVPVTGQGLGGWRSGYEGTFYSGPDPKSHWLTDWGNYSTGSAVNNGLLPPIVPLLEVHIRDAVFCLGGDGIYYMTGSTGENIWDFSDGVELWSSPDLKKWKYLGLVWSIDKEGTWEKVPKPLHEGKIRAVWAPEIHFVKGNFFICLSMAPGGVSILRSTTGKPEGPYKNIQEDPSKPFVEGIDATLFQDDNGNVYFSYSGASRIARMKDDMSGMAEPLRTITLLNPDHNPKHHSPKCESRGMNDLGHEGAVMFKANGKYYLGAADDYEGRYSTCLAVSDSIYGPYDMRHESVPGNGGTNFFMDKSGKWWSGYFGNDSQSPFREKPALIRVDFDSRGLVKIAKDQPFITDKEAGKEWAKKWEASHF